MDYAQQIKQLPAALTAKLRAPLVVNSLAQAVEELAANSVDAQATVVSIQVDVSSLSLTVKDDGHGVDQASFGSLAVHHATSKLQDLKQLTSGVTTLGFKGEALASIADMSLLHITSKARGSFETHMRLLRGGRVLKQGLAQEQRQKTGTIVCLKDFMFNQPVKRRQYLQSRQKELEACQEAVLRLALAYPEVEFVLSSVKPGRQLLRLGKDRHVTAVLPLIFGEQCNSLEEVRYTTRSLSIQGYVTVPPASFGHKHKQYLYINNRHVRAGQLGRLVNSLFRSAMSKLERPEESLRKITHQYPAFALQISCPYSSYDITSEPDKSHVEFADWPAVLAAVQAAVLDAWHSVVGDKLLVELQQVQRQAAELPAIDLTASASTDHAATQSSRHKPQFVPLSKQTVRHSSPAAIGAKRRHDQEQVPCFIDTDIAHMDSLFDSSAVLHTNHTFTNMQSSHGNSDSATETQRNSAPLPPQAAPRGLLHRLQSSVKLKLAQIPTAESQERYQQPKHAVSSLPKAPTSANDLQHAGLLDDEPEADLSMLWFPSKHGTHQASPPARHSSPAVQDPASLLGPPSTTGPLDSPSCYGLRQVAAQPSRRLTRVHQPPRKRRAVSAPPHYRTHRRSAHTNPLHSLHTDLHEAMPSYTATVHLPDAAATPVASAGEQAPHMWELNRQQHTVPGVCNQLWRQLGRSRQAQIPEAFTQRRHGSWSKTGQKTAQIPGSAIADAPPHLAAYQETAVHDVSSQMPSDRQQFSKSEPQASRKRIRFEPLMEDPLPADDATFEALPVLPTPDIPTTPHLTLPAAPLPQWRAPATPMTATPSASTAAGVPEQPAPPLQAGIGVLAQQASLPMPSVTELLQSWANPSIRPHPSKRIADLASVCGGGLHAVVPAAITRDTFKQAQTLRQMERKFIAVVCDGTLCVIDQHAADERVRLERLRAAVLGSQAPATTVALSPAVGLNLSSSELEMLATFAPKVERWGWHWRLSGPDNTSVLLTHLGSVLGAPMTALDLQVYLHQLADTHGSAVLPPSVTRILNAKACRSAIMFGDPLLPSECAELVSSLKATQLCFSCAHGRPTMAPLVSLAALHNQISITGASVWAAKPANSDEMGLQDRLQKLLHMTSEVC